MLDLDLSNYVDHKIKQPYRMSKLNRVRMGEPRERIDGVDFWYTFRRIGRKRFTYIYLAVAGSDDIYSASSGSPWTGPITEPAKQSLASWLRQNLSTLPNG